MFGGRITVFKRAKQPFYCVRDPFMGWRTRTKAEVELRLIDRFPSKHVHILREPCVHQIAEELLSCLERARKDVDSAPPGDWPITSAAS
jgi:hypothetical protein